VRRGREHHRFCETRLGLPTLAIFASLVSKYWHQSIHAITDHALLIPDQSCGIDPYRWKDIRVSSEAGERDSRYRTAHLVVKPSGGITE
jgi:hypothetical protein